MKLILHNSLTRKKEVFTPLDRNLVKLYVCGPTVYDSPHIGNARSIIVYDILYRLLCKVFGSQHVKYVRNITDVDDKIILRAKELNTTISNVTTSVTAQFHEHMHYLGCLLPNVEPKATMHIQDMIMIIEKLLALKHAYIAEGHVYFDISTYPDYTELSNRSLDALIDGVRIENNNAKKQPHDFVLWKPGSGDDEVSANFDSPFGRGRPGWHIECSAMSYKYLGEDFDIHGGGADLIFPHHTNEIAQSRCAFPNSHFAKYWVHNGFLTVNGEKMSKSLNNFLTVKDFIERKIPGDIIRLLLLTYHYRKPLNYNNKALEDATKTINYWYRALESLDRRLPSAAQAPPEFLGALLSDMNTPLAIKIINDYAKMILSTKQEEEKYLYASSMLACSNFIGLMNNKSPKNWFHSEERHSELNEAAINNLLAQRSDAKVQKNWQVADQIRQQLLKEGIIIEDKADGSSSWRKN